jgi:hypothetical protein
MILTEYYLNLNMNSLLFSRPFQESEALLWLRGYIKRVIPNWKHQCITSYLTSYSWSKLPVDVNYPRTQTRSFVCSSLHVQLPQVLEEIYWNQRHTIRWSLLSYYHIIRTRGTSPTWGVNVLSRVPLFKCESWRILLHSVEPPLDHESTSSIVEACAL